MKYFFRIMVEDNIKSVWDNFSRVDFDHKDYVVKATKVSEDGTRTDWWFSSEDFAGCGYDLSMVYFFEMFCQYGSFDWHETSDHYFERMARCMWLDMEVHGHYYELEIKEDNFDDYEEV